MSKQEFLAQLRKSLSGLPQDEIEERLAFYGEIIDDKMEEGLSEEEAVLTVGSVDEIVTQAVADIPLVKIAKERQRTKGKRSTGTTLLLVLGAPVWFSLGIAALSVLFSVWVTLWALIVSFWAVFASFIAAFLCSILASVCAVVSGNGVSGVVMVAAALVCAGLSIFAFYGCKAVTKGILLLTNKLAVWVKSRFIKKGEEE